MKKAQRQSKVVRRRALLSGMGEAKLVTLDIVAAAPKLDKVAWRWNKRQQSNNRTGPTRI